MRLLGGLTRRDSFSVLRSIAPIAHASDQRLRPLYDLLGRRRRRRKQGTTDTLCFDCSSSSTGSCQTIRIPRTHPTRPAVFGSNSSLYLERHRNDCSLSFRLSHYRPDPPRTYFGRQGEPPRQHI